MLLKPQSRAAGSTGASVLSSGALDADAFNGFRLGADGPNCLLRRAATPDADPMDPEIFQEGPSD